MKTSRNKTRSLRRISVSTTPEAEDAVAEMLGGVLGLPASSYRDHETGISTVTVHLQQKWDSPREVRGRISAGLKRIGNCGLNIGRARIVMARVRWEDWAESWKRHFQPIEIGDSLLIKPSWSKRKARKGQAVVVLDPGLSFGTGHHPTTAFCLGEIVAGADGRPRSKPENSRTRRTALLSGPRHRLRNSGDRRDKTGLFAGTSNGFRSGRSPRRPRQRPRQPCATEAENPARRRDEAAHPSRTPKTAIRSGLREPDIPAADRGTAPDYRAIKAHRNPGIGGNFEVGICGGSKGICGPGLETGIPPGRKGVAVRLVPIRALRLFERQNRGSGLMKWSCNKVFCSTNLSWHYLRCKAARERERL